MTSDFGENISTLRVDGGMVANDWLLQFLSDILDVRVDRPSVIETTALGAAYLAGLHAGLYPSIENVSGNWQLDQRFQPLMGTVARRQLLRNWANAVDGVQHYTAGLNQ